jgi:hypothetical protein
VQLTIKSHPLDYHQTPSIKADAGVKAGFVTCLL